MTNPRPNDRWNARYGGTAEYVYGLEPNTFLADTVRDLDPGDVLCLADGEGRNGVHLASLGHRVTTVDFSDAAVAKASASPGNG